MRLHNLVRSNVRLSYESIETICDHAAEGSWRVLHGVMATAQSGVLDPERNLTPDVIESCFEHLDSVAQAATLAQVRSTREALLWWIGASSFLDEEGQ